MDIHRINVSANLTRKNLYELGRMAPYHRYVKFFPEESDPYALLLKQTDTQATPKEINGATPKPPHFHCKKCNSEDFVFMSGVRCCHRCWTKEAVPVGMILCTPAVCASS